VNVSSYGHQFSPVDFDDLDIEKKEYNKFAAYGQSKTANILFARELNRRLAGRVEAFSLHPGAIMTPLAVHLSEAEINAFSKNMPADYAKTVPQGASTTLFAATSPDLTGRGGEYLEDNHVSSDLVLDPKNNPFDAHAGQAAHSKDDQAAARLWELSEKITGASLPSNL